MNKVEECSFEVWKRWHDETGFFIPTEEIEHYVFPTINPERYLEIHKDRLAWNYDIEEDKITVEDVNWEREQEDLGDLDECAVKLDDFDEEFAERMGYYMPEKSDPTFEAWTYLDGGTNWKTIWKEHMEYVSEYHITKDYVCLDEWNGRNFQTGGMGYHQYVHRIIDTDTFLIVRHSQWQGDQSDVKAEELSLAGVLDYIANIDDGLERDLEEYESKLREL